MRLAGEEGATALINDALTQAAATLATAWEQRRTLLVPLIGRERYAAFERQQVIRTALLKGKTHIEFVPNGSALFINTSGVASISEKRQEK